MPAISRYLFSSSFFAEDAMAICLARPLQQVRYRGKRPDQRQVALRSLRRETNQCTAEPSFPKFLDRRHFRFGISPMATVYPEA
jgi:hypothetical protein